MIEIIVSSGLILSFVTWCAFMTRASFRHDKQFAVIKVEMKHDREKLAKVLTLLENKLC